MATETFGVNALAIAMVVAGALVYFVPAIVAHRGGHRNASAITVLNVFLGWTFIGWVVALVWACTDNKAPTAQV